MVGSSQGEVNDLKSEFETKDMGVLKDGSF